jgi:DNA-directed RNA polymerase subunit RPC12/RpoP
MSLEHICSQCKLTFKITRKVRLRTAFGYQVLPLPVVSPTRSLADYQKVRCPRCGQVDHDDRLKVFGFFNPRVFVIVCIGLILAMLVADHFGVWPPR